MRSSLLAFATDLIDEGLDTVAENVQQRGGAGGITLATAYHDARDVFPHNPRRVVYFQEPGSVFFQPTPERFRDLRLQPVVSRLIGDRDLVAELVSLADQRGMDANAWVVLLHVDRGRAIEEFAHRNAFGDPYLTQLCPSNPDVRAYAHALIADVASRGVDAILMEAFHFLPFSHGYHHERAFIEISPLTSFLLSLCFCDSCTHAAAEHGVDVVRLRGAVQETIRKGLLSDDRDSAEVDDPMLVRPMFGGELGGLLETRGDAVTSLVAECVEAARSVETTTVVVPVDPSGAIKGYVGGQPTGPPAPSISWRLGIELEQLAKVADAVEVMAYASTAERVLVDLEAYAQAFAGSSKLGVILRPLRPDCESAENLRSKVEIASSLAFDRVDFYHYGLTRLDALDWIKFALPANSKER
jgi:hypothetical protein